MRAPMQYIHYQDVKLGEENSCSKFFLSIFNFQPHQVICEIWILIFKKNSHLVFLIKRRSFSL